MTPNAETENGMSSIKFVYSYDIHMYTDRTIKISSTTNSTAVLFYSILFDSRLFCSVLIIIPLYPILTSILFCSVLFYSLLLAAILLYLVLFRPAPFYVPFYSLRFFSLGVCSILFYSITFCLAMSYYGVWEILHHFLRHQLAGLYPRTPDLTLSGCKN